DDSMLDRADIGAFAVEPDAERGVASNLYRFSGAINFEVAVYGCTFSSHEGKYRTALNADLAYPGAVGLWYQNTIGGSCTANFATQVGDYGILKKQLKAVAFKLAVSCAAAHNAIIAEVNMVSVGNFAREAGGADGLIEAIVACDEHVLQVQERVIVCNVKGCRLRRG